LWPSLLSDAVEESFARHTVTRESSRLPAQIESDAPLSGARFNLYGIYPPDRDTPGGVALVEIKHQINDPEGNAAAKSRAKHPDYGPVLMLYYVENSGSWMTVNYDRASNTNVLDRVFRIELLRRL
jgi:hypothetical protein